MHLFHVNSATYYVPVVTLPINDDFKFLQHLKQGFTQAVSWNKYICQIKTNQKATI